MCKQETMCLARHPSVWLRCSYTDYVFFLCMADPPRRFEEFSRGMSNSLYREREVWHVETGRQNNEHAGKNFGPRVGTTPATFFSRVRSFPVVRMRIAFLWQVQLVRITRRHTHPDHYVPRPAPTGAAAVAAEVWIYLNLRAIRRQAHSLNV